MLDKMLTELRSIYSDIEIGEKIGRARDAVWRLRTGKTKMTDLETVEAIKHLYAGYKRKVKK